jgi:hypothetical protein
METFSETDLLATIGMKQLVVERQQALIAALRERVRLLEERLSLASAGQASDNAAEQPNAATTEGENT